MRRAITYGKEAGKQKKAHQEKRDPLLVHPSKDYPDMMR
jgi:hypothetical protein